MADLSKLHKKLTDSFCEMLDQGLEDPKVLKEIREFLKDNEIREEDIVRIPEDTDTTIDLDVDFMQDNNWIKQVKTG